MMLLPFIVIMVLPKLMNTADPETQKVSWSLGRFLQMCKLVGIRRVSRAHATLMKGAAH